MKKIKLSDCLPGSKVRITPNTVLLEVQFHIHGQTRLLTGNGTEGGWRDSKESVYLENQQLLTTSTRAAAPPVGGWGKILNNNGTSRNAHENH